MYKGLLRNYPAKPSAEDLTKVRRIKEEKEFQELAVRLRGEVGERDDDDRFWNMKIRAWNYNNRSICLFIDQYQC